MKRNKKSRRIHVVTISLIAIFSIRLWYNHPEGFLEKCSSYVIYPLLCAQHSIVDPIRQWFAKKTTIAEQETTIKRLLQERDDLMAESIELHSKLYYEDRIKELQEAKGIENLVLCKAQIIAKSFSEHGHYFLIDAGSNQGIKEDMIVSYKQSLLGKVSQVYPWYSKVIAVTDASCKVTACCVNTKTKGIHEGSNKLENSKLTFVSHLEKIEEGDYIISSGQGLVFPQGLGLGNVVSCEQDGLYYSITVKPLVDLAAVEYCTVLDRSKSTDSQV